MHSSMTRLTLSSDNSFFMSPIVERSMSDALISWETSGLAFDECLLSAIVVGVLRGVSGTVN